MHLSVCVFLCFIHSLAHYAISFCITIHYLLSLCVLSAMITRNYHFNNLGYTRTIDNLRCKSIAYAYELNAYAYEFIAYAYKSIAYADEIMIRGALTRTAIALILGAKLYAQCQYAIYASAHYEGSARTNLETARIVFSLMLIRARTRKRKRKKVYCWSQSVL